MRRSLATLVLAGVVGVAAAVPAVAAPTQITCTTDGGTVVLKIRVSDATADGVTAALETSGGAQEQLGVTCTDTTSTVVAVPNAIRFVCTDDSGDVVVRIIVNRRAAAGLGIPARAFVREAEERLGLTCEVLE